MPAIYLFQFSSRLDNAPFCIGAQNVAQWEESGAFTGEINADMLAEFDCKFSIVGHSERRKYFGETDEIVARKASNLLESGIVPLVCVGEGQQERENGSAVRFVKNQIEEIASFLGSERIKNAILHMSLSGQLELERLLKSLILQKCMVHKDIFGEIHG